MYLHYFENMPIEKIAAVLGIKKDAVKKQLQRGRQQMKERLECDYFE
jgi:DNA-directed RNA polymerase specialized sigma24 family protein